MHFLPLCYPMTSTMLKSGQLLCVFSNHKAPGDSACVRMNLYCKKRDTFTALKKRRMKISDLSSGKRLAAFDRLVRHRGSEEYQ